MNLVVRQLYEIKRLREGEDIDEKAGFHFD